MPYKRYDITNTYSYRGRRKNENVVLKTVMLFLLPVFIIAVLLGGAYVSYRMILKDMYIEPVKPVSTTDEAVLHEEELLRIVNEAEPLESTYVPILTSVNGVEVNALSADCLNEMINAAKADKVTLTLKTGYVSYDEQAKLHQSTYEKLKKSGKYSQIKAEAEAKKLCPPAGCSECQTGLLLEFDAPVGSDSYKWLVKYSVNYGFILRYPEAKEADTGISFNPNLYRFVGKESAQNIRRYDMSLEEYAAHISIR
ncbi:MAG: M15 family metallopeptidase [Ruminococcus sp.]|nr:M15 family metallopeptidase [Ruminococcus sp.]